MEKHDEFNVGRSQQEWSRYIADNALFYLNKAELGLVRTAQAYNADLSACGRQSLGVRSPDLEKAWASGNKFWKEFEAYAMRVSDEPGT
jgi:hypothetical protein